MSNSEQDFIGANVSVGGAFDDSVLAAFENFDFNHIEESVQVLE